MVILCNLVIFLVILGNIQKLQYQVILVLKQPKVDTNKIPWTVSGLEHPSVSMPAACYATKHIVHDIYPCVGVYSVWAEYGSCSTSPSHLARSSYPLPYHHKYFHIRLNLSMLSYGSTSKTYNAQCLSRS